MKDWAQQISEFQHSWLEQQEQLLSGWLSTMQNAGVPNTPQTTWRQAIDTMEQQVNSILDTQQQSLTALVKTVESAGNASLEPQQWEHQAEEGIELWVDTQHKLWKAWFEMLRSASPASQTPAEMVAKNWQDFMKRTVEAQEQWLSSWTNEKTGK